MRRMYISILCKAYTDTPRPRTRIPEMDYKIHLTYTWFERLAHVTGYEPLYSMLVEGGLI